jgi:4-amino-4-deoxy-L-arabinose transferase-like glycosyltransferase
MTRASRGIDQGRMIIIGFFLLLFLPFINKAFHIDDYAFIRYSHMVGWNPTRAMKLDFDYVGNVLPNFLPYEMTHPPLLPYLIKIVRALFGESEVALHLAFLIFPLTALFSLLKLNRIFFPQAQLSPVILGVCFCSLPPLLVNAHNIMADVPTIALLLLSLAGFFDGFENGSYKMVYLGSAALTLTIFTSYQMIIFIPLLFLYALWKHKLNLPVAAALLIPLLLLLSWLMAIYNQYGYFPVIKSKLAGVEGNIAGEIRKGLVPKTFVNKIFSILAILGAGMMWLVPFHYALKKRLGRFFLFFLLLLLASYASTSRLTGYPFALNIFLSAFVALGLLSLGTIVWSVRQRMKQGDGSQHETFLLLWVFCVIAYGLVFLPHSSARYLLPAFPPVLMLLLKDRSWSFSAPARRIGLSFLLAGAVVFSLASAYSDYTYANSYRNFAAKVKKFRAGKGHHFDIWYIGEWGMHYYMDKAGARYLHASLNEPARGDYVIIPEMAGLWQPSQALQARLALLSEHRYGSWLPLRLFNKRSQAGFYGHFWGMLPFAFSSEPDEVFLVFGVVR